MREISINQADVNIEQLDSALRTEFAEQYYGISTKDGVVTIHASDELSEADIQRGKTIVQNHDASVLSGRQQALANLQADINSFRQNVGDIDNLPVGQERVALKLLYKVLELNGLL